MTNKPIDIDYLAFRLMMSTKCSPQQAAERVRRYIRLTAEELLSYYNLRQPPYYCISLERLKNPLRLNVKGRIYHTRDILQTYNERLFNIMKTGDNLTKKLTQVKLNYNLEDIMLAAGNADEWFNYMYSPFKAELADESAYDTVQLDMHSLESYITSTKAGIVSEENTLKYRAKLANNLNDATRIALIGRVTDGQMPHIINESNFGRKYYKGPNLQNCPKIVRHAALGDCWEYDIESSALAWKLGYYKQIGQQMDCAVMAPATLELMDKKEAVRKLLARDVFGVDDDWAVGAIKAAITAIGFGAPARVTGYIAAGKYQTTALNSIITSNDLLQKFLDHAWVIEFVAEQKEMNEVIFLYEKNALGRAAEWRAIPDLLDKANRLLPNCVMAYLYQHAERTIIEFIKTTCKPYGVLLVVHDCVYTKHPLSGNALVDLRYKLKQFGEYFDISKKEHHAYKFDNEMIAHEEYIAAEELAAQSYGRQQFGESFKATKKYSRPAPSLVYNSDDRCADGSGYSDTYENYNMQQDPYMEDLVEAEYREYQLARDQVLGKNDLPDWVREKL
jgi:hypothetical protein